MNALRHGVIREATVERLSYSQAERGHWLAHKNKVAKYHGGKVRPEESARNESQPNGRAEEAGKTVREFVRVLKCQVGDKAKMKLKGGEPVIQWTTRWAAMVSSRFLVGKDGLTANERRKCRQCKTPTVPFGETVCVQRSQRRQEPKEQRGNKNERRSVVRPR